MERVTIIFSSFELDLMIICSSDFVSAYVNQFHDQIDIYAGFITD